MVTAAGHVGAGHEFAGVDDVLRGVVLPGQDQRSHIGDAQRGAVFEHEALDRCGLVAAEHDQPVARGGERNHQIAIDVAEGQQVLGDFRAKTDRVDPAAVLDAIAAVADAEQVGIVAETAGHRVRARAAADRIVAVVEPDQRFIGLAAGQQLVENGLQAQHESVGEAELLDLGRGQPADDRQHIEPAAQIDDQVVAVAAEDDVLAPHRCPEHHRVDHTGNVVLFDDRVGVIARGEGIGIRGIAADQGVVSLPPVQRVGVVERTGDDVVAAIAALDLEDFLDVADRQEGAVVEFEPLDPIVDAAELVAHAQRVRPPGHRDDQVVAVAGEHHVGAGDVGAELDHVVDRHAEPAAVLPVRADAGIDDHVLAITDVKFVTVSAVGADQQIVATAPVDRFGKVGAGDGVVGVGPDEVDVLGVVIGEHQRAVGELEVFHREMLRAVADVLVLEHDPVAGRTDRHDQVERGTRELDVGGQDAVEEQAVVAAVVEHGVGAIAAGEAIRVVPAQSFQPIVARPAVEAVVDPLEAIDDVVLGGLADVDEVLEQLEVRPIGPVAELDRLDQVDVADE